MATLDELNKSISNMENRPSERRKWFSLKRGPSKKEKIVQNILQKQENLGGKIAALADDRQSLQHELANTNKCIADMTRKIADLVATTDYRKEFDQELKRQLSEGRSEHSAQSEELRRTGKERHRLELEVCRLEAQVKKLQSDLDQAIKERENAEESLIKNKNIINNMKEEKLDLHVEIQRQEGIIRELNVEIQLQKENVSLLRQEVDDGEKRIEKMREERGRVLEYMKYKSEVYEDRLKTSWLHINGLKQERDQLKGIATPTTLPQIAPNTLNNEAFKKVPVKLTNLDKYNEVERQKTRILQLELQLYRREKLVEILADKLRQHDNSFSLVTDSSLLAYLDENWSAIAVQSPSCSEQTAISSELSAPIQSEFSSATSIAEHFCQ